MPEGLCLITVWAKWVVPSLEWSLQLCSISEPLFNFMGSFSYLYHVFLVWAFWLIYEAQVVTRKLQLGLRVQTKVTEVQQFSWVNQDDCIIILGLTKIRTPRTCVRRGVWATFGQISELEFGRTASAEKQKRFDFIFRESCSWILIS